MFCPAVKLFRIIFASSHFLDLMRFLLYVSLIDMSKGDLHVWRTWFFVFFETMDPWFQTDDAKAAHSELCENKKPGRTYCARFEIAEGFSERQLELFMISNEAIDDFLPSVCVLGHLRHQLHNPGSFQYCISCFLISTGLFLAFVSALQSTQLPSPAHLWFPPLPEPSVGSTLFTCLTSFSTNPPSC